MLFHTLSFLGFFSVVLPVYWTLPGRRLRLAWLLGASAYFYMSWNPWLVSLILFSASVDYLTALWMERLGKRWQRRLLLLTSVGTNLGLLAFFKYVNFFLSSVYAVEGLLGGEPARRFVDVVLPLGISFYTFETISYIVDVYQGRSRAVRDPLEYALYILFFPHLVAGPIVRPRDFLPQLRRQHRFNWDRLQLGWQFFLVGLFKKAVLADNLVLLVDPIFAAPGGYGSAATWLAVLAYSAQIYLDFSGYSDMAVGLAHMLGYRLPRNFNMPYLAANIADFWRRWHISLSTWLRDYLFIPLGGSRGSTWQTCRNLFVTMLLGGLWHGASWTFVAWGAWHGVLLVGHRLMPAWPARAAALVRPLAMLSTFLAVAVGWVFFRAQSFGDAGTILYHLFYPTEGSNLAGPQVWTVAIILLILALGHLVGALADIKRWERVTPEMALGAGLTVLLLLILLLSPENGNAFIYFQFSRLRANRRRGLRILLWTIALFWLAQLTGGLVLDYVWVRPRYPMLADMYERLSARKQAPAILFMGSSRFAGDVHEAVVDAELRRHFGDGAPRSFNASLPAGDPTVFERVLGNMFEQGYHPRLVVVEVDPATLAGRDNWLYQHALNVLDWRDVPEAVPALCHNRRIMYLINGRFLPLYLHRYHICKEASTLAGRLRPVTSTTIVSEPPLGPPVDRDPEPPVQTAEMKANMEHGYVDIAKEVRDYRLGGVVTRRLERLLEHCQSAGVKVLLVGVPVSSPSRRATTPPVMDVFLDYMRQLTERYDCCYVDWRDQVPDAYFIDMHHASHEGGVYFSRRFASSVLVPTWRDLELQ